MLGKVKTRLAASVGHQKAFEIYNLLLTHTHCISKEAGADKFIFYEDFINHTDLWENEIYEKALQRGDDLGERMKNAFKDLFNKSYVKIIIIGSDCLDITSDIIREGFEALSKNDIVIGPAKDGGYYLLGMKHFIAALFENKKWSSASVYMDTIHQIKELNKSFYQLKILNDIDEESDIDFLF